MGVMKERMLRGELYIADEPALGVDHARAQELLERYNAAAHTEHDERERPLRRRSRSAPPARSPPVCSC